MTKQNKMQVQDAVDILRKRQAMAGTIKLSKQAEAGIVILEECQKLVEYIQQIEPSVFFLADLRELVQELHEVKDTMPELSEKLEWLGSLANRVEEIQKERQEQVHAEHSDET